MLYCANIHIDELSWFTTLAQLEGVQGACRIEACNYRLSGIGYVERSVCDEAHREHQPGRLGA
jgi:hypothetical protein